MYKFVVLSILAIGCSALPQQYPSSGYGYSSGSGYTSGGSLGGSSLLVSQPQRVQLVGLQGGYQGASSGLIGSGLSTGFGVSSGLQSSGIQTSGLGLGLGVAQQGVAINSVGLGAQNNFGLLSVRQGQQFEPVVHAAIQQIGRTVEYRPFANQEQPIQAQVVEIEPSDNPVHLHFKTRSSTLSTSQSHIAAPAVEVQTAAAQDEPQRLITEVQKPVIQEVREVISPYRQVTQEINPVVESLHTIVTKGEGQRAQYQGANFGAQYQSQSLVAPVSVAASQIVRPVAASIQTVQAQPIAVASFQSKPIGFQSSGLQSGFQSSGLQSSGLQVSSGLGLGGSGSFQSSSFSAPVQSSFQTSSFQSKPLVSKTQSSYTSSSSSNDGY